jgi:proliferating cell nuclear antigen
MQFKVVISPTTMKDIINAIKDVAEEVRIQVSETGLKIQAVDPANVCMVFLDAPQDAFEYYKTDAGDLALDMIRLDQFTNGSDSISMELDPETHKMAVDHGRSKFSMSMIDPTAIKGAPRVPNLDMPCSIVISGADVYDAIQSAIKVSDHAILEQDEENFVLEAKGDIDSVRTAFQLSELTGIRQGMSRAVFSLDYLADIAKVARKVSAVQIETGIDYPTVISFGMGKISVRYMLAPRIEQD